MHQSTIHRVPLCLIPARGGSKRVLRKNIVPLGGRPLLAWTITPALESGLFPSVVVSSDDEEILAVAKQYGALAVPRPAQLAEDNSTLLDLCMAILPDLAAQMHATDLYLLTPASPFRTAQTMRRAWREYIAEGGSSLVSVEPFEYPPQWALALQNGRLAPLFPNLYEVPRPRLEQALKHDGGHIVTDIARLLAEQDLFGPQALPFFGPEEERLDIDFPHDLERARSIVARKQFVEAKHAS